MTYKAIILAAVLLGFLLAGCLQRPSESTCQQNAPSWYSSPS